MVKYRLAYAAVLLTDLMLVFFYGNGFLLMLLAVLMLLPLAASLLLRADLRHITVSCSARAACLAGQPLGVVIEVRQTGRILAAGRIQATLYCQNFLFGEEYTRELLLRMGQQKVELAPELCGMVQVSLSRVECFDLFGLSRVSLPLPHAKIAVVHPRTIPIEISSERAPQGYAMGDRYEQNRRGSDASEVFDLREYQSGDDVRAIHWKLSSKLGSLILREASEPSYRATCLLFDAGLRDGGRELDRKVLSAAVELGTAVSGQLIRQGEPHEMLLATSNGLQHMTVHSVAEHLTMVDQWMGLRLQETSRGGLMQFRAERMEEAFTKLVYITAGQTPEGLNTLAERLDVTVLCVAEPGVHAGTAEQGSCQILLLPADQLRNAAYHITI